MTIERIKERYDSFTENELNVWKHRFIWRGLYGDSPKYTISILQFALERTKEFSTLESIANVDDLSKTVSKLSKGYVKWIKEKDDIFTEEEYLDLENFFKGAVGEFFFTYLLNEVRCVYSLDKVNEKVLKRNDFIYASPRLPKEKDFGTDLTCVVNDKASAIQVKFWNPYNSERITNEIAQSCFADAVCNNFINVEESENIVICWLGNTKKVSKFLKDNTALYKHIIFIDKESLKYSIDNRNTTFWKGIYMKFLSLIDFPE